MIHPKLSRLPMVFHIPAEFETTIRLLERAIRSLSYLNHFVERLQPKHYPPTKLKATQAQSKCFFKSIFYEIDSRVESLTFLLSQGQRQIPACKLSLFLSLVALQELHPLYLVISRFSSNLTIAKPALLALFILQFYWTTTWLSSIYA